MSMKPINRQLKITLLSGMMVMSAGLLGRAPDVSGRVQGNQSANVAQSGSKLTAGCSPATAITYLELNNVRCRIDGTKGGMWMERATSTSGYEVPKGSGSFSIFAGALWMGGLDVNGQLKLAAFTYGQGGNDFWPGPLNVYTAEIDAATCAKWDKYFYITRDEVDQFVAWWNSGKTDPANYTIPQSILNYPAHGDVSLGQDYYLAPFYDVDGDGQYDPEGSGDYPYYDLKGEIDCRKVRDPRLFGDVTFWWIFNDKGNVHTETNGPSIGMEIRGQAFAFATNDEVNNMTFYNYALINRSTFTLTNTFFGQWADTDLGYSDDDYVGCDVQRGLGYAYNGDAFDEDGNGVKGYGNQPPAIGIDFFEGPYQDNDGMDNPLTTNVQLALSQGGIPYKGLGLGYGDGIVDNERMGMFLFNYYNRGGGPQGDPNSALEYYNYMRGFWRDNSPFTYGGNGKGGTILATHMFPGNSDPVHWSTKGVDPGFLWTEQTAGNTPGDRRFIQSAGPFTLQPGAVNDITVGVVWERALSGGPFASVEKLRVADDKAQSLFDNCFKVLDGPDAPEVTIQELDRELIIMLHNLPVSNNYQDEYAEVDPFIQLPDTFNGVPLTEADKKALATYRFQGYQIFQVKDETVSVTDLDNPDKARLVAQCDIADGVTKLVNYTYDENLNGNVPQLMVNGEDKGVRHSFRITEDKFAEGTTQLVNFKTYYYIAIAYAYNNYKTYDPNDPNALDGQKKPYLASRKAAVGNIRVYSGIPHKPKPENGGTVVNAQYGDQPEITRVDGVGNGGLFTDLLSSSEEAILMNVKQGELTYKSGYGPVNIKVVDPLNVKGGDYELRFKDGSSVYKTDSLRWELRNLSTGEVVESDKVIKVAYEQIIPEWGISVTIGQVAYPGEQPSMGNGFIGASIEFGDSTKKWLDGIRDQDVPNDYNWIRAGTSDANEPPGSYYNDYLGVDDQQAYEGIINGIIAPYCLTAYKSSSSVRNAPAYDQLSVKLTGKGSNKLYYLPSIDLVFTNDKSKWTRAVVLETQEDPVLAEGGAKRLSPRKAPSVDKNGQPDGTGTGMGWFPGYAIDVETGERLNIAFGEDSWLAGENGRDMIWNPTSTDAIYTANSEELRWGGKHYIYIWRVNRSEETMPASFKLPAYDEGQTLKNLLETTNQSQLFQVWRSCAWVMIPRLQDGQKLLSIEEGLIPTETRIRIRVNRPYEKFDAGTQANATYPMYRFNMDRFATVKGSLLASEDVLSMINVVPNPYYAQSEYETSQLDNRVKIINLPEECTISIYNMSGTLVRRYKKADPSTYLDWDLKNMKGIPVSSGIYLIHVEVPGVGERVLKWFGVMRPVDLNTF